MKKVLLESNQEKAESLISGIEILYLSRVSTLIARITSLGVKEVTKTLVLEAIEGNLKGVKELYQEIYRQDLEVFKTPEMRNQAEGVFNARFKEIEKAAEAFQDKQLSDYLPFSLQVLAGIWDLDEKGAPFIPEAKKAVIIEGYKEYIENPELLRVYNLHLETARCMQDLVTTIRKTGLDRLNAMNTRNTMGVQSVGSLFLFEDNLDTGIFSVKPRRMEYKPEEEPEEVE